MEDNKTTNSKAQELVRKEKNLPEKFEAPQLIKLAHSANMPDLECLAPRGSSCSWK